MKSNQKNSIIKRLTDKGTFKLLGLLLVLLCTVLLLSACGCSSADSNADATTQQDQTSKQNQECFQAGIIKMLYETAGHAAIGAYGQLTEGALPVTMLGFIIWLAFRLVKHVSSFKSEDIGQTWTEISKKFFVCMVCGMLASSPTMVIWTLNTLIFPIFYSFLQLGANILNVSAGESTTAGQCIGGEYIPYQSISCEAKLDDATANSFPTGPGDMMVCMVCGINARLSLGNALSTMFLCMGVMEFFMGIFLMLVFLMIKITFAFYIVDTIFRFALMVTLFPLMIMAYAFNLTKKWAITGFKIIMNVSALLMFMGVVLSLVLLALETIINDYHGLSPDKSDQADNSYIFLMIMLIAFLMVESMNIAKSITDSLVGGGVESNFAKTGAKALAYIGEKLATQITHGASKLFTEAAKRFEWAKKIQEKAKKVQEFKNKIQKAAGRGYGKDWEHNDDK